MSNANLKSAIRATLAAVLVSDTHAAGSHNSDGIDMGNYESALICANVGTVASAGSIQLEQATTANFSDAKDLRPAVDLATNAPVQISLRSDELDVNGGFRYVRAKLTCTGGSVKTGILLLGLNARYQPAAPLTGTIVAG